MATATIAKPAAKGGSFLLESPVPGDVFTPADLTDEDRKSTRLNSSHQIISYAVFCLKKKSVIDIQITLKQMLRDFFGITVNRAKKSCMDNITSRVKRREMCASTPILTTLNPLSTSNV